MFNRRSVCAGLAAVAATPRFAFAQAGGPKSAFYSGVGNELTHYEVDPAAAQLAKRGSIKMPGGIQYAWPHPSKKFLYVTSSTGGPGFTPGPGTRPTSTTWPPSGSARPASSPHGDMSSCAGGRIQLERGTTPANTPWSHIIFPPA